VNFLVSAGPTREFFDTVRYLSNPSSGKMGYAIAREAARRGHRVTLVTGPVALRPPRGVVLVPVLSAAEMARACKRAFRGADVAVMTAAVCDYRPGDRLDHKLAKKGKRLLVGFAMEDRDAHRRAERKLKSKNCDLIVLNGPENVGGDRAVVELYRPVQGWSEPIRGSKAVIARRLVRIIEAAWAGAGECGRR